MNYNICPENISSLNTNEIFVFGSNESGFHGAGAAKKAIEFGAKYGCGIGHYGNTYAIPTKDKNLNTLPLSKIKNYVDMFIKYVKHNKHYTFLITQIGCGLAGYTPKQIAPLFKYGRHLENICYPKSFIDIFEEFDNLIE